MAKIKDPGFGYKTAASAKRMVNSDGSFNLRHINKKFSVSEIYSRLINMSWMRFIMLIFIWYGVLNLLFASMYYVIGVEHLTITKSTPYQDFLHAYFFSAQTLTTLGYGLISPQGNTTALVSSIEALIGLMGFALMTGLLYGRFSKPKAAIRFSDVLVLRPFKEKRAIMFRLMNKRVNVMIEPEITVTLAVNDIDDKGNLARKFFKLSLERDKIMYLPTTWTVVHEIDEKSPLKDYTDEQILALNAELLILIEYYEDDFAQNVYQMHSYSFDDLKGNSKFVPAYYFEESGQAILDHSKLSEIEKYN
ncbi:ion channel [Pseudofulvibacter geojedonensis]|uniref:Ion channel n=1 Tax=Pseudofulvibacter geojedonensis TaxID=1123758 RepID=A0ABW3HYX3_9FLAO